VFVGLGLALGFLQACGGDEDAPATTEISAGHIHGLGVNPGDGALFVATHAGLFRLPEGSSVAEAVGDKRQDMMGFTIDGPDGFLGSGHPAPTDGGPPNLGLIESTDAGRSWRSVSLGGQADFHVLRSSGERIYGLNGLDGQLMVSSDGGRSWEGRRPPTESFDLAIDPANEDRLLASTGRGVALSEDRGLSWRVTSPEVGLLAWPTPSRVYLIDGRGSVRLRKRDGSWSRVGSIGEAPVALTAADDRTLYAALEDGRVLASEDGGATWGERASLR
jgi:photosystem II stability/assembly factor-like uncharacterized protein